MLNLAVVGGNYFRTTGITLRSGRGFQASDRRGAPLVAVVSERVARVLWPAENPVGKRIRFADSGSSWRTVVGVAAETRYRALRDVAPTVYLPMEQFPEVLPLISTLVIRTRSAPGSAASSIRYVVQQTDPEVAVLEVTSFSELIGRQLSTPRLTAVLAILFGAGALLLVAAGLYAALGSMVRERRRELAIRQAIGATPRQLRAIVLAQSLAMGAAGVSVGLLLALAAGRLLRGLLYGVPATDPVTAVGVLAVLAGVILVASYVPARRATQADSLDLLRQE